MIGRLGTLLAVCAIACMVMFVPAGNTQACCGQYVDIYECTVEPLLLDACDGDLAVVSGSVYEYYWSSLDPWPMEVTVAFIDDGSNVVRTLVADLELIAGGPSDGVDDDGDGVIDEDVVDGIDNDLDGRIDEDPGLAGDDFADIRFTATWDCLDESGEMVPTGGYDVAVTASAGGMGSATAFLELATTSEEPCCVEGGGVRITPETINKDRFGKWITGHPTAPDGYTTFDVISGRIVSIDGFPVSIPGDVKGSGEVIKFPSADVIGYLPMVAAGPAGHGKPGRIEDVEICVEIGLLDDNVSCALCDTVDVIGGELAD